MKHDIGDNFYLSCVCFAFNSAQKSARDVLFKAVKKPMDLFPRVTRADAILFVVQCHGLCHGKMRVSSRPIECKMTTLMIDESNVSTSHWRLRFLVMFFNEQIVIWSHTTAPIINTPIAISLRVWRSSFQGKQILQYLFHLQLILLMKNSVFSFPLGTPYASLVYFCLFQLQSKCRFSINYSRCNSFLDLCHQPLKTLLWCRGCRKRLGNLVLLVFFCFVKWLKLICGKILQ